MSSEQHNDLIREEFTRQAATFSGMRSISTPANVQWILDNLPLDPTYQVLDIAAGTGAQSRAMAPYVRQITAVDLTPAMLRQGQRETEEAGIHNIRFEQGLAEQLPHPSNTFDLAVNRFAIHHMTQPANAVREMASVARGQIALIDLISPDDPDLAGQYNAYERLRDPSHVTALSRDMLAQLVRDANFEVNHVATREIEVNLEGWMIQTKTPREAREMVMSRLKAELDGGTATGMQPRMQGDDITFIHTWCVVVGRK